MTPEEMELLQAGHVLVREDEVHPVILIWLCRKEEK